MIKLLENKNIITKETVEIFTVTLAAYIFSIWAMLTHHYFLQSSISLMIIGSLGNLYVITFNKNKMPVPLPTRTIGKLRKTYPKRGICKLTPKTKLPWLADKYRLRKDYWSLGDFFITGGVILFVVGMLTGKLL